MIFKYKFKNINLSYKKADFMIRKIKNFSNKFLINISLYLSFLKDKFSFILKKIFFSIFNDIKNNFNLNINFLKLKNLYLNKGFILKRLNYRAKGNFDIIRKKYFNLFLFIFY